MSIQIANPSPVDVAQVGQAAICQTKLVSTLVEKVGNDVAEGDIRDILVAIAELRTELRGFCVAQTKLNEQRELALHDHTVRIDLLEKYRDETSSRDKIIFGLLGAFGTVIFGLALATIKHMLNI